MVVVVENEGDRIQLVPLAAEAGAALLLALPDGSAEGLHGAGGCAFVSGRWCGSPVPLLAVADGHNHRVLLIDVTSKHGVGVVRRSFHGGGGGARGRYRRFRVPTDVAEPREGVLAITDRDNGRLVLIEWQDGGADDNCGLEASNTWRSRVIDGFDRPVGCCPLPGARDPATPSRDCVDPGFLSGVQIDRYSTHCGISP